MKQTGRHHKADRERHCIGAGRQLCAMGVTVVDRKRARQ